MLTENATTVVEVVLQLDYFDVKWNCAAVCRGTSYGFRHRVSSSQNLTIVRYIKRYENCTFVDGNLEITFLSEGPFDLSFLSSIQEVTYYTVSHDMP